MKNLAQTVLHVTRIKKKKAFFLINYALQDSEMRNFPPFENNLNWNEWKFRAFFFIPFYNDWLFALIMAFVQEMPNEKFLVKIKGYRKIRNVSR